ncbi:MAG: transposase [Chloroflexi bacterium]|nr:transposase [Chloroflexota bacterium]
MLPPPKAVGRPRVHPVREILNATFYVVRSGCAWRLLSPCTLFGLSRAF